MTCGQCGAEITTGTVCPVCAFDNADNAVYPGFIFAETRILRWVRVFLWAALLLTGIYILDAGYGLLYPSGLLLSMPYNAMLLAVLLLGLPQIVFLGLSLRNRLWAVRVLTVVHVIGTALYFFCISSNLAIGFFASRLLIAVILLLSPWEALGYARRYPTSPAVSSGGNPSADDEDFTDDDVEEILMEESRIDEEFNGASVKETFDHPRMARLANIHPSEKIDEPSAGSEEDNAKGAALTEDLPEIIRL